MAQWRRAAKELAKIRDAELRQVQPADELDAMSLLDLSRSPVSNPHENGLVIQQKWFMRQRLLQLAAEESDRGGPAQASSIGD
jgi:hypothetical protein